MDHFQGQRRRILGIETQRRMQDRFTSQQSFPPEDYGTTQKRD